MEQALFHEFENIIITYQNNDLLSGRAFSGHLNSQFGFWSAVDNFVNLIHFLSV